MNTIVVWVLVAYFGGYNSGGGMTTVDNIASKANCEALAAQLRESGVQGVGITSKCIAVRKVRP